jgi:DNA-binding LacI/PurR family transcriptional regulator
MVTLKDIAKEAGVSVMTVSRVINKRYTEVSEENISKIQEIINKLGYVPNSSARSLSSKSSKIISIIIQGNDNPLESPYNATMLGHIIQRIQERGYNAMVHFIDEYSEVTKHLQSWKAEGAIFLGTFDEDIQQIQADNKIPLVFTDSYSSVRQVMNIGIDDYKGGVLAAEYFIENGHRDFAFIAPYISVSQLLQQRLKGFKDTIEKANLTLYPEHILEPIDMEDTVKTLVSFKQPVSAIFAATDNCAIELMDLLKRKGYNIPLDYSIIGFDNLPISQYITPRLTTISQDINQKAQYALDVLFQHLNNRSLPTQNMILDVDLIKRESVCTINGSK